MTRGGRGTTLSPLTFTVPGTPVAQGSMRHVGGGHVLHSNDSQLRAWRRAVAFFAARAARLQDWPAPYDGPVTVAVTFHMPRPKHPTFPVPATGKDLDKLVRAVGDSLSPKVGGKTLTNDSRIVRWDAGKVYADQRGPHATITITPWKDNT